MDKTTRKIAIGLGAAFGLSMLYTFWAFGDAARPWCPSRREIPPGTLVTFVLGGAAQVGRVVAGSGGLLCGPTMVVVDTPQGRTTVAIDAVTVVGLPPYAAGA